jgi:predicted O-methyltransferase YrrM
MNKTERIYNITHDLKDCTSNLSVGEYSQLLDLILDNDLKEYLELGVMNGGNLVRMSNLLELNNHSCNVTAYDCFDSPPKDPRNTHTSGWPSKAEVENKVNKIHGFGVEFIQGLSSEITDKLKDKKYDIIFHDADHSFQGVYSDLIKLKELLNEDGFVTVHDTTFDKHRGGYGAGRAVSALVEGKHYNKVGQVDSMAILKLFRKK